MLTQMNLTKRIITISFSGYPKFKITELFPREQIFDIRKIYSIHFTISPRSLRKPVLLVLFRFVSLS